MNIKKLTKTLRKFENSGTLLHEYFYELLVSENTLKQSANMLGISEEQLNYKFIHSECTILDFIRLVEFYKNKQYETN